MEEMYEKEILPKYKELLEECLKAFNEIPNRRLSSGKSMNTYELASKISKLLEK